MKVRIASLEAVQVILPKQDGDAVLKQDKALPFVFLIGPVLGGGDWQLYMLRELAEHIPSFVAAVPCRWQSHHRDAFRYGAILKQVS